MNSLFWSRAHGVATHFPIALILGATLFDLLAFFSPVRLSGASSTPSVTGSSSWGPSVRLGRSLPGWL